jgi:uncharacterized RmlC-like cupin family protein
MIDDVTSTCQIVSARPEFVGKHGYLCAPGISKQSVGARGINLQIAIIPPGAWAKAHKYDGHETALHILSGEAGIRYGERLEQHLIARAGDFLYIPPDMPHLPYNLSDIETCVAIIARTDPDDQESVVLLPELERVSDSCCGSKSRGPVGENKELELSFPKIGFGHIGDAAQPERAQPSEPLDRPF